MEVSVHKKRSEGRGVFLLQEKLWHWCSSPTRGWRNDGSGLCSNLRSAVFCLTRGVMVVLFSQHGGDCSGVLSTIELWLPCALQQKE